MPQQPGRAAEANARLGLKESAEKSVKTGLAGGLMVLAAAALMGGAQPASAADLAISHAYMRIIIHARPAAGYFTLKNESDKERVLVGASSPSCQMLMLHESVHKDGMDEMIHVPSLPVPPHGSITFQPGHYHLMCMEPAASMRPGTSVSVTLKFKDGGTLTSKFPVHGPTG